MNVRMVDIRTISDERGSLSFLESGDVEASFDFKRIYYIYGVPDSVRRGFHAHKTLIQLLICMHGSIEILLDDGREKRVVTLDHPSRGLWIPPGIWREMHWQRADSVLCVLASAHYSENDYIREYAEFLRFAEEKIVSM